MTMLRFAVPGEDDLTVPLADIRLVIAGWTGRDPVARDAHIRELAELGIAPPATTPIYYRAAASRLTQAGRIETTGATSSGEVEFVLVRRAGRLFVGVASDHTDREVETYGVTVSKQMCDKPIAPALWPMEAVRPHWDRLTLRATATIGGEALRYQEGAVAAMLAPDVVLGGWTEDDGRDLVMLCGTLAAIGGIRPATRFDFAIEDPVLGRSIAHGYDVDVLPIAG